MTKAKLKKALLAMEPEELRSMILDTYTVSKEARDYMEYWLEPDPEALFTRYEEKVKGVFFTSGGKLKPKPKLAEAKKMMKAFAAISSDPRSISAMMIRYPEIIIEWIQSSWKIHKYAEPAINNIVAAREYVEAAGLEEEFADRLKRLAAAEKNLERYV